MNDDTNQVLTRAYELIESEHLDEAKALLDPLLEREKDSADTWWLYAHAVQNVEAAQNALENVLRIDPDYPGAKELLQASEDVLTPAPSLLRPIQRIDASQVSAVAPDLPPTLPENVEEPWGFDVPSEGKQAPRRLFAPRLLAVLIPLLVIVVVAGLLLVLNFGSPPAITGVSTATAEEQASVPTLSAATSTPIPLDTIAPSSVTGEATLIEATAEKTTETVSTNGPIQQPTSASPATGDPYEPLYEALSTFTIPRNAIEVSPTSLGDTLLVSICTLAGPELRNALPEAMTAIASVSQSITTDLDAIGARMMNCGNNTTLLVIGVPLEDAVAYSNGDLDDEAFQALWSSQ